MDILTALHDANPTRGDKRCKLQRILDEIPDDTVGKADLLAAVEDAKAFPAQRLTLTFSALGKPCGNSTIADHRAKRCPCFL